MQISTIQNEFLSVSVKHHGAELCSIKQGETEYMWQANSEHWNRHAPVLFPIIGELKNGEFYFEGKKYAMKRHGLARNLPFELIEQTDNKLIFSLKSNEATLEKYPFLFELQISYTLKERALIVGYKVINSEEEAIYFSIGGHPAFNIPLNEGEKRSDYQLHFDKNENAATQRLTNGLRNGITETILDNQKTIAVTDELFEEDALVFHNLNSTKVSIQKEDKKVLTFNFSGFPYLGIWSSSSTAPFVCVEPWCGVADSTSHNQQLVEKEGIVKLNGQKIFERSYAIEIH